MTHPAQTPDRDLPQVFGETALSTQVAQPSFRWEADRSFSLDQILVALLRRKWILLAVVTLVVTVSLVRSFRVQPLYRAVAMLQIEDERQNLVPYKGFGSPIQPRKYIDTQIQRIQSPGLRRQISETLGRPLNGVLTARQVSDTMLVHVSFTSPVPEDAAEVANLAAEQFIERHLAQKVESTGRASTILETQLDDLQEKLHGSEEAVLRYARTKSIVNLNDRETMARGRLSDLTAEVSAAEKALFDMMAQIDMLGKGGTDGLPAELRSDNLSALEGRLRQIDLDLAGLSVRFGPEWPTVKKLRQEKAELSLQHQAELASIRANLLKSHELSGTLHRKLVTELQAQRTMVDRLSEDLIGYELLERESELNKRLYEGLLQRLKEGGIAESMRSDNIQLVDRAMVPIRPISPNRQRAVAQALVLGLFMGLGAVVLIELLDNTIKGVEDVTQRIGLPSLGMIPALKAGKAFGRRWLRRHRADAPPTLAFEPGAIGQTPDQEAYRSLRTSLLLSHSGTPPQAILVTSAFPQDGKSTTAINMAIALAQTGARTVIIDLDIRNGTVAGCLGVPSNEGMSTYLSGNTDLASQIRETDFPNLFIVPGGPTPPNPAELIGSARLATGMQLLREYFTYVVVDSPPCLGLSDPLLMCPYVDGVILVARSRRTPRKILLRAAEALHKVGATFLGVLVNNVAAEPRLYGYNYGSYGRYYGRYYPSNPGARHKTA